MSDELVRSAALEERLRFADELHDTYLQTLAAIDMHAEAARIVLQKGADSGERVHEELQSIKSVARTTAQRAREFVDMAKVARRSGPDALTEILEDRWKDCYTLLFDEDVQLTEGQWKVLEMMLREGLNNAKRHAGASHVRMEVVATGRGAKATLIANGKAPAPDEPFGYGLSRLDAIARANNGVLSLLPGDPGGSELTLSFQRRKL
jgi:signal transduction histidine kinase